jgi:hypothetical protein
MSDYLYSGSRWREAHTDDCNAYPVRHLLYFIQSGTAIANNKSCLKGIGEVGSGKKQSITWELITRLKTDLV